MSVIERRADSSHWYYPSGEPCYELPKKDGGMKTPTLADARKLNLLPSVTSILKILHREELVNWMMDQVALAVATTPRSPDEQLDTFIKRVLSKDRVQDEEAQKARDLGTRIHDAMECLFRAKPIDPTLADWILPAYDWLTHSGGHWRIVGTGGNVVVDTERIVTTKDYAGRIDLIQSANGIYYLWDYKSAKTLPKNEAYPDHLLQCAAYAHALRQTQFEIGGNAITIKTGNVYISTTEKGLFKICEHEDWNKTYQEGFCPLLAYWQWSKNYRPTPEYRTPQ